MTIPAQFEIYSYTKEGVKTFLGEPPFSLPPRIKYLNKVYIYMANPSVWADEEEYCNILNSHNSYCADYDPNQRRWFILFSALR